MRLERKVELDSKIRIAELSTGQDFLAVVTETNSLAIVDLRSGDLFYVKSNSHQSVVTQFDFQLGNLVTISKDSLRISHKENLKAL